MGPVKLLIVAGPYEGERLRRAASADGPEIDLVESVEHALSELKRPGQRAVLVAGGAVDGDATDALLSLRRAAGNRLHLFFVGDADDVAAVSDLVQVGFSRVTAPEEVMTRVRAFLGGRPTIETPVVALASPALPIRIASSGASVLLNRVADSIDDDLDAEMLDAAKTAIDRRLHAERASGNDFASATDKTREAPPELVHDMLAGVIADVDAEGQAGADDMVTGRAQERRDWERAPATSSGIPAAVGAALSGAVAAEDLPMLLGRAFLDGITGRLKFRRGDVEKAVYLEGGRPVLATSTAPSDRMIEMLARQGRITPAQHQVASRAAADTGRRMGVLLIDLGILKSSELLPAVRQHYEEIIFSLFAWEDGGWQLEPGIAADPRRIRLLRHPVALVEEGLQRGYPEGRMLARLGSERNVFRLDVRGGARDILDELRGAAATRGVAQLFDGVRTLEQVEQESALPSQAATRLFFTLLLFRLITPAAPLSTASSRGSRGPARDIETERARILARFALVREGDYFQILALGRGADLAEIRRAQARVLAELAALGDGSDLTAELDAIRTVVAEAARVLGNDRLRAEYAAHLQPAPAARMPAVSSVGGAG